MFNEIQEDMVAPAKNVFKKLSSKFRQWQFENQVELSMLNSQWHKS
jgi:hypothetical protein